MTDEKKNCKINKGRRQLSPTGNIMVEEWLTVEGKNLKETSEEFNKQWKEFK